MNKGQGLKGDVSLTVQFKKCFGVELLRIQSVRLLPDFPELSYTTLSVRETHQKEEKHVERALD